MQVQMGDDQVRHRVRVADRLDIAGKVVFIACGRRSRELWSDLKPRHRVVQARGMDHEFFTVVHHPHAEARCDRHDLFGQLAVDHVDVSERVDTRTAVSVSAGSAGTCERRKGRGCRDHGDPPDCSVDEGRCTRSGEVAPDAGMRQPRGIERRQRGTQSAVRIVEGVVRGGRHDIHTEPAELGGDAGRAPHPTECTFSSPKDIGADEVVQWDFQMSVGDVCAAKQVHCSQDIGIATHRDR
jgi:hypothetical protein